VRDSSQPAALPLRPMTTGELLDAAVALLRLRPLRLLVAGLAVALAEQAVLFPLRRAADVDIGYLPADDRLGQFAVLLVAGAATEACCIALLGGLACVAAPAALLGPAAPANVRGRPVAVTVLAVVVGVLCGLASATLVAWPFVYGLLGLVVPAAVIDGLGPGRALLRSLRLASRTALRVVWIRLLGYYAWFVIRLALGFGGLAVIGIFVNSPSTTVDNVLTGAAWLAVNALAYPMLACLDACLHLEARMRTEGLDIALRRALSRGVSTGPALAVPR
jgi:hypothetical protein